MTRLAAGAGRLCRAALDLVFPPRCGACGREGAFLCDACRAALVPAGPPRCPRCWRPGPVDVCAACRAAPPSFDLLRAAFVYQGVARELVHALKYRGATAVAEAMAPPLAALVRDGRLDAGVIVPVPLAGPRRRARGYNQAQVLARALGRAVGVEVSPRALARRRHGPAQARSAGAEERRRNVEGAFAAREDLVTGRRLLLVDDVTTTGATLDACAAALRGAGVAWVGALAYARED